MIMIKFKNDLSLVSTRRVIKGLVKIVGDLLAPT